MENNYTTGITFMLGYDKKVYDSILQIKGEVYCLSELISKKVKRDMEELNEYKEIALKLAISKIATINHGNFEFNFVDIIIGEPEHKGESAFEIFLTVKFVDVNPDLTIEFFFSKDILEEYKEKYLNR